MNVTAVPATPLVPDALPQLRTLPQPLPGIFSDSTSLKLPELADPEVRRIFEGIEKAHVPEQPSAVVETAVAQHSHADALEVLRTAIIAHPDIAAAIVSDPALHAMRDSVHALFEHMAGEARGGAEKVLAAAVPHAPAAPQVFTLANRFFETGQYVNYIRAQELGRVVLAAGTSVPMRQKSKPVQLHLRIQKVWSRAPLLILFGVWMLTGLIGWAGSRGAPGVAFDIWGVGFLALVGIQFCITIRNFRSASRR